MFYVLARIIHERLRPSRGSFPPDTSSDLLCDAPGIAVVGLPRPDEKSLAGTRCTSASHHLGARDRSFLNKMRVFRPGVRELSGLGSLDTADGKAWNGVRAQGRSPRRGHVCRDGGSGARHCPRPRSQPPGGVRQPDAQRPLDLPLERTGLRRRGIPALHQDARQAIRRRTRDDPEDEHVRASRSSRLPRGRFLARFRRLDREGDRAPEETPPRKEGRGEEADCALSAPRRPRRARPDHLSPPPAYPLPPTASSACSRSAIRSATSSMPTEIRTSPAVTPRRLRSASGIEECVIVAGCEIRVSTPPRLSPREQSRTAARKRLAAS